MWTITKEFTFSASHQLTGLKEGHPCMRLHGHNYRVRIMLRGYLLDAADMVFDYGELDWFGEWIKQRVDHQHLNDLFESTTAESLARIFFNMFNAADGMPGRQYLYSVAVSETPKTWATYMDLDRMWNQPGREHTG